MKDHYDFSNGRKNPYAKKLKDEGYSILINYNPKCTENDGDAEAPDEHCSSKVHGE